PDHFYDFQFVAVIKSFALSGHVELLDKCIFHLSRCPGKLDHCNHHFCGEASDAFPAKAGPTSRRFSQSH
ncbi:hypothetical protein ABEH37_23060, partial [Pseudomonas sp. Ps21-P2]